jgi:hypothetical protein
VFNRIGLHRTSKLDQLSSNVKRSWKSYICWWNTGRILELGNKFKARIRSGLGCDEKERVVKIGWELLRFTQRSCVEE